MNTASSKRDATHAEPVKLREAGDANQDHASTNVMLHVAQYRSLEKALRPSPHDGPCTFPGPAMFKWP